MKKIKTVNALRLVRRMRGETQSCLIEADDGYFYIVKFSNNPQGGNRVLVNEVVGSAMFAQFGIATPETAQVNVDAECLGHKGLIPTGLHFGSRHAGARDTVAVYDFLPDPLLQSVHNRSDFIGALMVDKWMSNTDARQAIFVRPEGEEPGKLTGFCAQMIDNSCLFAGADWTFRESAVQGLFLRHAVYGGEPSMRDFEPWIKLLMALRFDVVREVFAQVPPVWLQDDGPALGRLLDRLYERRVRVPAMIEESLRGLQMAGIRRISPPSERHMRGDERGVALIA